MGLRLENDSGGIWLPVLPPWSTQPGMRWRTCFESREALVQCLKSSTLPMSGPAQSLLQLFAVPSASRLEGLMEASAGSIASPAARAVIRRGGFAAGSG